MAGEDIIMASQEELRRLHVIQKVLEGGLKQVEAAEGSFTDREVGHRTARYRVSSRIK